MKMQSKGGGKGVKSLLGKKCRECARGRQKQSVRERKVFGDQEEKAPLSIHQLQGSF